MLINATIEISCPTTRGTIYASSDSHMAGPGDVNAWKGMAGGEEAIRYGELSSN